MTRSFDSSLFIDRRPEEHSRNTKVLLQEQMVSKSVMRAYLDEYFLPEGGRGKSLSSSPEKQVLHKHPQYKDKVFE